MVLEVFLRWYFCDNDDVEECDTEGDDDDVAATEQSVVFWRW